MPPAERVSSAYTSLEKLNTQDTHTDTIPTGIFEGLSWLSQNVKVEKK